MEQRYIALLSKLGKTEDIEKLDRLFNLYVYPIRELLQNNEETEQLLFGLELMYAFCMYEDRIIDIDTVGREDALLALYFHNEYLRWLISYGEEEIEKFELSISQFIEYTQKERTDYNNYDYNFKDYIVKEAPIINHIKLISRILGKEIDNITAFIEAYYMVVLINDDIEDLETDVMNGQNTYMTAILRKAHINPSTVRIKNRSYWEFVDKSVSSWIKNLLNKYRCFSQTAIYKNIQSILFNINNKLDKKVD